MSPLGVKSLCPVKECVRLIATLKLNKGSPTVVLDFVATKDHNLRKVWKVVQCFQWQYLLAK